MSTYAIGDIQGCYQELQQLLTMIQFNPQTDELWSVGDLVNRGPQSLEVLRFFKQLGDRARVVLGNHDLHLLALAEGITKHADPQDTLAAVLQADDKEDLLTWLRQQPLLHYDPKLNMALVHAGLPPQWDLAQARQYAAEVETMLRGHQYSVFLAHLYGEVPQQWSESLEGWPRLRFITHCLTRLRYCTDEGILLFKKKGRPDLHTVTAEEKPWFLVPNRRTRVNPVVFGHWSTLGYYADQGVYSLDSGCVWGGALTVIRLEDKRLFQLPCAGEQTPDE